MVNIAVAGSSGLAQFIAHYISTKTSHQFIILSRSPNPALTSKGWQVLQVDYSNNSKLRYVLTGVDVVISTVSGQAETALITAAAQVKVRRFIPSEFEGPPSKRVLSSLPDRGNNSSLALLQQCGIEHTTFVCGVFYERFAPGGMAAFQLGQGSYIDKEGEYLLSVRSREAEIPHLGNGQNSFVCMTSAQDVAQAVVAALDLPQWPREFKISGDRLSLAQVVNVAEVALGQNFKKTFLSLDCLNKGARTSGNPRQQWRMHHLIATVNGCYDFETSDLNCLVGIRPQRFQEWLRLVWT